jgi:hypothetical protein
LKVLSLDKADRCVYIHYDLFSDAGAANGIGQALDAARQNEQEM